MAVSGRRCRLVGKKLTIDLSLPSLLTHMQSGFEWVDRRESKIGFAARKKSIQFCLLRASVNFPISKFQLPTSRYMLAALYVLEAWHSETKSRGPELSQNYQYIRLTGACGRRGGESLVAARKGKTREGRKGSKSNERKNSLRADALEHLCDEAHDLTLRACFESQRLPALSVSVHVDESGL